ncbi:MAG: 50S ribosomal protein L14 [Planctomycetes bacterium]|nr:50S ribosomal protein L14 [Planctomycetota bacterium]MCB9825841.1 50S ribosomal protein L14 [Planctomycetota bacterium]MCB9829126.1 50S ribosomal protein L14 [Planctomycetota bacterium]MCB9901240.1 50S ribosomal protein L14 [Planctomycetota bacterium]
MIQLRTWLDVADNSGAKRCHAIKVLGRGNKSTAEIGDIVVASVKKAIPSSPVKPGSVVRGVVVRTRNAHRRSDGTYVRFDSNAIVLINDDKSPKGTRVFGAVARELRKKGFTKIVNLASEVV